MAADTRIVLTAVDKTRAAFDSAKASMAGLSASAQKLNGLMATLGAGTLAGGGLLAFAKAGIDAADNLNDLSQKIGVSVEKLAGYKLAAESSGTSLEGMAKAAQQLAKNIAQNDPLLARLGVTSKDVDGAMAQLADVFKRLPDGTQKTAIALQLMGKSGAEMIPMLNGGGEALRQMVEDGQRLYPVTAEMAREADKFNDELARMKTGLEGLGVVIGASALPTLNKMLGELSEGIRIFGGFGSALANIGVGISPLNSLKENLAKYRKEIADLEEFRASAGAGADASFFADVDARLETARKRLEFLKYIQGEEALALNEKYGTANYKIASPTEPDLPGSILATACRSSAAPPKLDTLMTERDRQLRAAELAEYKAIAAAEAEVFDGLLANEDARVAAETESLKNLTALRSEYMNLIDPVQAYREKLEEVQKLLDAGFITQDQAAEMRFRINEMMEQAAGFGEKLKEETSLWEEAWKEAMGNMQDALADFLFDPFDKGLDGMLLGFVNTLRRMAAEALAADIMKSIFGSAGTDQNLLGSIASIFGFADGGVMTSAGPLALKRYAGGGVANSPQLALFGEGATPEAFVPLPDGRNIPVKMQSSAAQSIRIVNAFDVSVVGDYLGSADGEKIIMNAVRRNSSALRQIVAA